MQENQSFRKVAAKKLPVLIILPILWLTSASMVLITMMFLVFSSSQKTIPSHKYSVYSSKPLVLGVTTSSTGQGDPRAAKIDNIFKSYNCPLTGLGKVFVEEADKNEIPYWLVAAVAFQESSCGKLTPEPDGVESYNAWGWGVYGDNIKMFSSWDHGIKVVSKYMDERFFSQGVTEPCDIMKVYTPPSRGSWCKGVEYFKDQIDSYQTPQD